MCPARLMSAFSCQCAPLNDSGTLLQKEQPPNSAPISSTGDDWLTLKCATGTPTRRETIRVRLHGASSGGRLIAGLFADVSILSIPFDPSLASV